MRQRSANYFFGSLFSSQFFLVYGIAGAFTTTFQLLLLYIDVFSGMPRRTESLPIFIEMYIETLLPVWIGHITA